MRRVMRGVCCAVLAGVVVVLVSSSVAMASGDANRVGCSNESATGFRSYLADCRAYELVTPAFKDGFRTESAGAVSSDGSRQLEHSVGSFAGVESDIFAGFYLLSRSAGGWVAAALNPPASRFPANELLASDSGVERTLWAVREATQSVYAEDLYRREPDGAFVKIGSMVPPSAVGGVPAGGFTTLSLRYRYAGASSDLSHVLFTTGKKGGTDPGALWPGDTTGEEGVGGEGGNSLYEYVGTGQSRPALVGVSDGTTVVNGTQLPEGTLISDCTINLGAQEGRDVYNAVSKDGETVFFTAVGHSSRECLNPNAPEVSELYARLGGIETVAISEPTAAQCAACNTAARAPAEFRGASQDGAKVFFLTEQELLPGATGPNLYEYDFNNPAGSKVIRVSTGSANPEVQGVARVSQDGSHVYFVAMAVLTEGLNREGGKPAAGGDNLYVFERDAAHPAGRVSFIATLAEGDESAVWEANDRRAAQATPDGRYLAFSSSADLTLGDTSSEPQIFEYDAETEELARVSVGQAGYAEGAESADAHASSIRRQNYEQVPAPGFRPAQATTGLAISNDGRTVVFNSVGALAPEAPPAAAAGAVSVYEYRSAGTIKNGGVFLVSDGVNAHTSPESASLDASGADVFFQTEDRLLPADGDTQFDFYDAREAGGFSEGAGLSGCSGEACHGVLSLAPVFGAGGSATSPGEAGAPVPPVPSVTNAKGKPAGRAQRLARALRTCRRKRAKKRRAVCEAHVRKRFTVRSSDRRRGA